MKETQALMVNTREVKCASRLMREIEETVKVDKKNGRAREVVRELVLLEKRK